MSDAVSLLLPQARRAMGLPLPKGITADDVTMLESIEAKVFLTPPTLFSPFALFAVVWVGERNAGLLGERNSQHPSGERERTRTTPAESKRILAQPESG